MSVGFADLATSVEDFRPQLLALPEPKQEQAIRLAVELSMKGAFSAGNQLSPNAAGDFWTVFLELFKMLLPLIIELLKG